MRTKTLAYAAVSLLAISTPAFAQDVPADDAESAESGEIIVSARRREESLQDVPLVVNAVTAETIEKLNLQDAKDL